MADKINKFIWFEIQTTLKAKDCEENFNKIKKKLLKYLKMIDVIF